MTISGWLSAVAWPWLQKNWKPLVLVLAAMVGGFVLARACAPKPAVPTPIDIAPVISSMAKIDETERAQKEAARVKLEEAIKKANDERDAGITTLTAEEEKKAEELLKNGDNIDDWLIQIGKGVRQP